MIDVGDVYPASVTVRDPAGALANASTVTVTITRPDGTTVGPETITPTRTGVYDYDYPTTMPGRHLVRWVATGSNAATYSDAFDVVASDAGQLISLTDLKTHLNITRTDSDEELRTFARMASEVVEQEVGPVLPRTITETVSARTGRALLSTPRVLSVVSTNPAWNAVVSTWGEVTGDPLWGTVEVTYRAGMSTVPATLRLAALEIARGMWRSQRGAAPLPLQNAEGDAPPQFASLISPVARELLAPYRTATSVA